MKNQRFSSSILLNCKSFWQITFLGGFFFSYFHRFEISVKFCEFWILKCQKRKKNFWGHRVHTVYEYMLELVECKFARNGLTNWKTFLTNVFENIIWHLFAGESHQVVKITVPYCTCFYIAKAYEHMHMHQISASNLCWNFGTIYGG